MPLATVALTEVTDPSAYGVVDRADDGRVRAFVRSPIRAPRPATSPTPGAYVLDASTLSAFPDGASSIERDVFPALATGGRFYSEVIPGTWVDAGTLDGYLTANFAGLDHESLVVVHPGAAVAPDVTLDRVVLGPGVTVGQGAMLRDVVVMANARIGPGAVIEHSVVGAGAEIGAHVQMRDRLVAFDAVVAGDEPAHSGRAACRIVLRDAIFGIPEQVRDARLAQRLLHRAGHHRVSVEHVLFTGMGGSGMAAEIALALRRAAAAAYRSRSCAATSCRPGCRVRRWWSASRTPGETEETLSVMRAARDRGALLTCITAGGALAAMESDGALVLPVPGGMMPRAGAGFPRGNVRAAARAPRDVAGR